MPDKNEKYSAAWRQFLVARQAMLDAYDRALTHAREQKVPVHHGVVGEAAVREWLTEFLPKRYGVTSGHIRSQGLPKPYQTNHFDVIIYDQLESPTLWIEDNRDKSSGGRMRIIPAEFVRGILEVKAAFSSQTVREAANKLSELRPLTAGFNADSKRYPRYLPAEAVIGVLFFELRAQDGLSIEPLRLAQGIELARFVYGPVILRGEGRDADETGLIQRLCSATPQPELWTPKGLLADLSMTATAESKDHNNAGHVSSMLNWSDIHFSGFAFDLLALLNGTYRPGYGSSFHGLEIRGTL